MPRYGRDYRGGFPPQRRPYWPGREQAYGAEYVRNETRPYSDAPQADFRGERYDLEFSGRGWPHGVGYERGERPGSRGRYGSEYRGYGAEYAEVRHRGWRGDGQPAGSRGRDPGYDYGVEAGRTPSDRWPDRARASAAGRMSDGDLRQAVEQNLFDDSWIEPRRIQVEVESGVVTLRGDVRDFMEARYAWDDVWETPGVRGVVNHLTVRNDTADPEFPQTAGEENGGRTAKK